MKRLFMLLCAVVAFAACEQAPIEEMQGAAINERNLEVSFEGGDDTRIQLQNGKTVWTEGDHVSVFYRSTVNEEWQFMGETGDRTGQIVPVDNSVNPPATHNHVVVAYPYSADYFYNTETHNVEASLPAVQSYLKDSYGTNGNIMISSSEFNKVSLKSVCGWLKLQLTGDGEVVKSITLRGNDGEQVAGLIYVDSAAATATLASASGEAGDGEVGGALVRPGTILTEVTLDCGEGVTLGKESTAFYIALPPQTFEQGFTVEIKDTEGYVMEQSTDKALTIERNTIKPMAAFEFINPATPSAPTPASNEIWYTATAKADPYFDDSATFGADIVSNVWDSETKRGIITFDGDVTSIGDSAFRNCSSLTSVTIPDSVTTIGYGAFKYCPNLTSVNIPDGVTEIGVSAFCDCISLTSVTIPDSVTTIGNFAFEYCRSLTSVTIPDSVTTIGYGAFMYCDSLKEFKSKFAEDNGRILVVDGVLTAFAPIGITEYNIPDSVTTIGDYAFEYCRSLTSVTIPDSVTTIGNAAFEYCRSLTSVYCKATTPPSLGDTYVFDNIGGGLEIYVPAGFVNAYKSAFGWNEHASAIVGYDFEKDEIVAMQPNNEIWYTSSDGDVVTPYKTNVFGANIISNKYNNGMGIITFDGVVTTIGEDAFDRCSSLTSVNIPDSVTTIGMSAFYWCTSLTSVNIPDSVTRIGQGAFDGCTSLTSVNIPDRVTEIGSHAFISCSSLTSANIPDSVTTIGDFTFAYCTSLTSVNIGDSVTTIGGGAFYDCRSLTSVNIPDSVTKMGSDTFYDCRSLTSVYCKATTPPALSGTYVFDYNGSGRKIYVPAGSVNAYKSAEYWSEYADAIVGYDFENGEIVEVQPNNEIWYTSSNGKVVTPIHNDVFGANIISNEYNNGKGVITFDGDVTKIGSHAFYGYETDCNKLTSVTIPDSVTTIGEWAFAWCDSLTSVTIGDSVTTIGEWAFAYCDSLTSVTIPDSVTTIEQNTFYNCTSLTSVTIPDGVTKIGEGAFKYCTSLTSVTIPDSVTTIGEDAFYNCKSLKTVYCKRTTPPAGGVDMFCFNASERKIYVPASDDDSIIKAYKAKQYWKDYRASIFEEE